MCVDLMLLIARLLFYTLLKTTPFSPLALKDQPGVKGLKK
jgi:hypothetical protein